MAPTKRNGGFHRPDGVLSEAGMNAQFERSRCAISRGILIRAELLYHDASSVLDVDRIKNGNTEDFLKISEKYGVEFERAALSQLKAALFPW